MHYESADSPYKSRLLTRQSNYVHKIRRPILAANTDKEHEQKSDIGNI